MQCHGLGSCLTNQYNINHAITLYDYFVKTSLHLLICSYERCVQFTETCQQNRQAKPVEEKILIRMNLLKKSPICIYSLFDLCKAIVLILHLLIVCNSVLQSQLPYAFVSHNSLR